MPRHAGSPRRLPDTIPTSQRSMDAYNRACEALRLRTQDKLSYREVAVALGYKSPASAYEAIQRLLKKQPKEDVDELRAMEAEKLDRYEKRLDDLIFSMTQAAGGDEGDQKTSSRMVARNVEVAIKLLERRAKMLGLDSAEKREHEIRTPTVVEYFRDVSQDRHTRTAQAIIDGDFDVLADLDPELAAIAEGTVADEDSTPGSPDPGAE